MYEITYLVFIRYRGPFGISIPLPRLRTAHLSRPLRPLERFDVAKALFTSDNDWESTIPPSPCHNLA